MSTAATVLRSSSRSRACSSEVQFLTLTPVAGPGSGNLSSNRATGVILRRNHCGCDPQQPSQPVRIRGAQFVNYDDPFDHVGEYRRHRTISHPDSNHGGIPSAPDGPIDPHEAGRAPKPRHQQPLGPGRHGELSGGLCKICGVSGVHVAILTKGCHSQMTSDSSGPSQSVL